MSEIPTLDFLFSEITDVHFGYAAYLVITLDATDSASGVGIAPPTGGVTGPDLIFASLPATSSIFKPPVTTWIDYYFIWSDAAVFPTVDTVGEGVGLSMTYGGQFSVDLNMNTGGFGAWPVPGANADGFYSSFDAAITGAAYQTNQVVSRLAGPYTIEWLAPIVGTMGPAGWTGFTAGQVSVPITGVGTGASTMKQQFLFGPLPVGSYGYSVNFGGSSQMIATVDAKLIFSSGGKVTSFANFPGGITVAGSGAGGHASGFSVSVTVGQNVNGADSAVVVDFAGGGGGGH